MINSAMHGGIIDESKLVYHVFDAMPFADFNFSKCDLEYTDRLRILFTAIGKIDNTQIKRAESWHLSNADQIQELYNLAVHQSIFSAKNYKRRR